MKDLSNIRKEKRKIEESILKIPGVIGIDVGKKIVRGKRTDEYAIRVYVTEKKLKKDVQKNELIPSKVGKFKTDVIQMRFKPNVCRKKVSDLALSADRGRYDPLQGGISIGPCRSIGGYIHVGTLGMIVNDNTSGDQMMLSNYHVMAVNSSWSSGDTLAQPALNDGGRCPRDVVGEVSRASLGGTVDCAVAILDTDRDVACSIQDIGDISGSATVTIGDSVRKRGRTTELTHGTIDSIDLTVSVDYDDGNVILTGQIGIAVDNTQSSEFGLGGDSGSVVVNGRNEVVGLYFAGNIEERDDDGNIILAEGVFGIANPIEDVLTEMDVSICVPKIKEFKEKEKEFKEFKEKEKEFKEFKEKDKDKEFKEFKEKDKDKEFKEFKEKDKDKEFKEFKELKEKDKDKDIFENPGGIPNDPITKRIEALENTINQLSHFIKGNLRPDLTGSSFKNEQDIQKKYMQKSRMAKQYKDQKDSEHL